MKVSAEEVKKIALLSRLEIKEDRVEAVQQQLSDILSYMELIEQADISEVEPTAHAVSMSNVMRDDVPQESLPNEDALRNARKPKADISKCRKLFRNKEGYCGSQYDT